MVTFIKKLIYITILINLLFTLCPAGDLDVSDETKKTVRNALVPVVSYLSIRNQLPAGHLLYPERPGVVLTAESSIGATLSNRWFGIPGMWSSVLVTENLLLSASLSNTEIDKDNAQSFGSGVTTSWGEDSTKNFFTLGINYIKGPDDFYYQNINLSIQKRIILTGWQVVIGYTKHFNRIDINVRDNANPEHNYSCDKRITPNHFRAGISKQFENIGYGLEITFSRNLIGGSFTVTGFLP